MHETTDDLARLQTLLDESHASMGEHMRDILTPERRLSAQELADVLQGMRLLSLATVTARCEPRVGPVDSFFYRGQFWFGTSRDSVRVRHMRARPAVSAVHLDGEELSVTVHGKATLIDITAPEHEGLRKVCIDNYGESWTDWGLTEQYVRIDADRMYTYFMRNDA